MLDPTATFERLLLKTATQTLTRLADNAALPTAAERDQALHVLSFALANATAWPLARDLLLTLAPRMEQLGHRSDWIPYLERGLQVSESRCDAQTAGECQLQLGLLYRLLGEFDQAQQWVKASIATFALTDDKNGQARAYLEQAWIDHLQHRYIAVAAHVEQAQLLLAPDAPEQAICLRILGTIALDQGRYEEAESYQRAALPRFEQLGDRRKAAWTLHNLANALRGQTRYREAINYYEQAATLLLALGDQYHWAMAQMNLGTTYCNSEQPAEGLACHRKAQQVFVKLNDKLNIAKTNTGLGIGFLMQQEFAQAVTAFQHSSEQFAELGYENWRLNALDGLAMTYLAAEHYEQAVLILEQAIAALPQIVEAPNYSYLTKSLAQN